MKLKLTLLELILVWLAGPVALPVHGKVVGNINDGDGDTLTILNIEDENKTHYLNQNFEVGNYNYGYDVKPNGPVGQFHHENKSPEEVVYGCYGYEGPDSQNHMTFYISDAWGYRPVRPDNDVEIFYPADNPEGTGHMNGKQTKWADLFFPDMCAHVAERIASSSNVVTNAPVSNADKLVTASALPSTVSPAGSLSTLTTFGTRNTPVPAGSFDVIQFNTPAAGTIGPQPTSGRLTVSSAAPGGRITGTTTLGGDLRGQDLDPQFVTPSVSAFSSSQGPSSSAAPARGTSAGISGGRFPTATRGGPGTTLAATGSTQEPDITESLSSNNGGLLPSRGTPSTGATSSSGPTQFSRLISTFTTPNTESPLNSEAPAGTFGTGQTFNTNRFVATRPTPTLSRTTTTPRPFTTNAVGSSSTGSDLPPGRQPPRPAAGGAYGSGGDDDDNVPSVGPTRGTTFGGVPTTRRNQPTTTFGTTRNPAPATTFESTRNPAPTTTFGTTRNPAPTTTFGTTRNPAPASSFGTTQTGPGSTSGPSSTLVTEPASPESTFPTGGSSPQSTNTPTTFGSSPFTSTPTGSSSHSTGGFSGSFNNPSTLQPSSTNQQTVPGSTNGPTGPTDSTSFRQTVPPSTGLPQGTTSGPSAPSSLSTSRGPTTFSLPSTRSPSTSAPLLNASSPSNDFCATQCSSCGNSQPTNGHQQPTAQPTVNDEDFLNIPGALLSQIPVIFYPDCSANAYQRPAIVPFCPSQQPLGCASTQQPLTMRFPEASHLSAAAALNGPVARNAFALNQGSNRVTRKVRRGRQQRLAHY